MTRPARQGTGTEDACCGFDGQSSMKRAAAMSRGPSPSPRGARLRRKTTTNAMVAMFAQWPQWSRCVLLFGVDDLQGADLPRLDGEGDGVGCERQVRCGGEGRLHQVGLDGVEGAGWDVEVDLTSLSVGVVEAEDEGVGVFGFFYGGEDDVGFVYDAKLWVAGRLPVWGKTCCAVSGVLSS